MRVLKSGAPMLQSTARATLRLARTSNRYTHATRLMATQQVESTTNTPSTSQPSDWEIKMLYDGDCPLCMREVELLKRRDEGQGKIAFVDVASPDYSPDSNAGISYQAAMERIHAILPDGTVVQNVEVFRRLYEAVGLGWVYSVTKIPAVEKAANALYDVWAKYRLPLTGRSDLEVILQQKDKACGEDKACDIPTSSSK